VRKHNLLGFLIERRDRICKDQMLRSTVNIIPITEQNELERIRRLKTPIVDEAAHFNLNWLTGQRWWVVPVESASHFDISDAELIARAFHTIQCSQVFALATENLGPDSPDFLVETSVQGLLEFNRACAHFNFLLVPANRSAAVLCTVYDYYLVAGPIECVKVAIGGDIAQAWSLFEDCAAHPVWEGRLEKVAKRYKDLRPLTS
jgi:hypothetical protein